MVNIFSNTTTVGMALAAIADSDASDYFGFGVILDDEKKLLGIITLKELSLYILDDPSIISEPISQYYTKDFIYVSIEENGTFNKVPAINKMNQRKNKTTRVRFVPIVDANGGFVNVMPFDEIFSATDNFSVSIYGLGFVGLTLFATLSSKGFSCIGIEKSNDTASSLKSGILPVIEDGLDELYSNLSLGDKVYTNLDQKISTNTKIICVGTDINEKLEVNEEPLKVVVSQISQDLKVGDLVILRSTVPVGYTRTLITSILEKKSGLRAGKDFSVAFCPERTVEGKAIQEINQLPQIIGGFTPSCAEKAAQLFNVVSSTSVVTESLEAAEFVKLLNNSFRDLSFAFSNELIQYADKFNIDSTRLVNDANFQYPRNRIALPSPGVGGYCLTKDPYIYSQVGFERINSLSKIGRTINEEAQQYPLKKFIQHAEKRNLKLNELVVGVLGIAFKGIPDTNDIRRSSGLKLAHDLSKIVKHVSVFDPNVDFSKVDSNLTQASSEDIFINCDAVFIMNNNPRLIGKAWQVINKKNKTFFLFDGWLNLIDTIPTSYIEKITFCTLGKVY
jgi:UDP-N-acetyl-D-mannosaminuronic acid dehydrogenase